MYATLTLAFIFAMAACLPAAISQSSQVTESQDYTLRKEAGTSQPEVFTSKKQKKQPISPSPNNPKREESSKFSK